MCVCSRGCTGCQDDLSLHTHTMCSPTTWIVTNASTYSKGWKLQPWRIRESYNASLPKLIFLNDIYFINPIKFVEFGMSRNYLSILHCDILLSYKSIVARICVASLHDWLYKVYRIRSGPILSWLILIDDYKFIWV